MLGGAEVKDRSIEADRDENGGTGGYSDFRIWVCRSDVIVNR